MAFDPVTYVTSLIDKSGLLRVFVSSSKSVRFFPFDWYPSRVSKLQINLENKAEEILRLAGHLYTGDEDDVDDEELHVMDKAKQERRHVVLSRHKRASN